MYELKRILVPTDFSAYAAGALEHAVLLGARYEAEITLMHVDEFIVSPLGAAGLKDEFLLTYQRKKEEFLERELSSLATAFADRKVRFRKKVLSGRAYKVIVEEAEKEQYDLIVIATRGLTALSTYLIGNTTERVVRLSRQPVLSVQSPPQNGGKLNSILCPTDLSPAANFALSYAVSIARRNEATLYIQYISELEKPEPEAEIRRRMPNLEEFHPMARQVHVEYIFDRDVEPSNAIIRFAEDREISLIVMATHGRKGLRRVYIGNNTAEVVRQSSRPVLTVTHPFHKAVFTGAVTQPSHAPLMDAHDVEINNHRKS